MNSSNLIKDIIEKIKLWWKNLFKKKKIINQTKKNVLDNYKQNKKTYHNINKIDNGNKSSNIGIIYPKLSKENLELLKQKGFSLKRKILNQQNKNNNKDIEIVDLILTSLNTNEIYVNQGVELNYLLNNINKDQEFNLNTTEKLNLIKDNISSIIDKKLNDYETSIVKKAYLEYKDVNYIIVTTLIIDDLIKEINELSEDFEKNKLNKIEYEQKINKIKEKIDKLEIINNRKEITQEIEDLRKDFYTKKKDKYDLLYNDEIFINLNQQCDQLLKQAENKEKNDKLKKEKNKIININIEKEKARKKIEEKKREKQKKELEEQKDNILKRFIDMEIAHRILLLREKARKKLIKREEIINETLNYYNDFLIGETNNFIFERNRTKIEVIKLYNDITSTIYSIKKKEFIPLEHINIKLQTITEKTLENQTLLNYMIEKKYTYKIEDHETNKAVTNKLNNILKNEKDKDKNNDKSNDKVLKKEYILQKKEDKNEK